MSTEFGVQGTPVGPPWSVDDLADIHAGVYDAELTLQLRARIAQDEDASAVMAALDSTVDELSLLPTLVMPEQYVLRLDRAIAAEALARSESSTYRRTTPVTPVTGGLSALLQSGAAPAQAGLPQVSAPTRSTPLVPRPAQPGPPPRRAPLIPRVLPGAELHRPATTGPGEPPAAGPGPLTRAGSSPVRPASGLPPYAPTNVPQQVPYQAPPQLPSHTPQQFRPESMPSISPSPAGPPRQAPSGRPTGATGPGRGSVSSLDAQRAKRSRAGRWIGGLAVAAAAAAIATFSFIGLNSGKNNTASVNTQPSTVQASTTSPTGGGGGNIAPGDSALTITPGRLGDALDDLQGKKSSRFLDAITQASCLSSLNVTGPQLIGFSDATFEGKQVIGIAAEDPKDPTKAIVYVVGTGCGKDGSQPLAQQTVPR